MWFEPAITFPFIRTMGSRFWPLIQRATGM
jgi:hypothetical protein